MRRNHKQKRKEWLDRRSRKMNTKRKGARNNRRNKSHSYHLHTGGIKRKNNQIRVSAPSNFSLFNNSRETLEFFYEVENAFEASQKGDVIFFDLSKINAITADAIMYLIALLKNTYRVNALRIQCYGNRPLNEDVHRTMIDSGFYHYVQSAFKQKASDSGKFVKISHGSKVDDRIAKLLCDFVNEISRTSLLHTKRLYPMIIELMTNTQQHAYRKAQNAKMRPCWYVFAQELDDFIQFVFLDTGIGIPKTINKRMRERIKEYVLKSLTDADYIASAFNGEIPRSETKEIYRGKGLPGIYRDVCNHAFSNFSVISGRGVCVVANDGIIDSQSLEIEFRGTLFLWTVEK